VYSYCLRGVWNVYRHPVFVRTFPVPVGGNVLYLHKYKFLTRCGRVHAGMRKLLPGCRYFINSITLSDSVLLLLLMADMTRYRLSQERCRATYILCTT
jgi:hypothetical protein